MSQITQYPNPSARYTVAESFAMPNYPAEGLMVWQSDLHRLMVYSVNKWEEVPVDRMDIPLASMNNSACWLSNGTPQNIITDSCLIKQIQVSNTTSTPTTFNASTYTTGVSDRVSLFAGMEVGGLEIITIDLSLKVDNLQAGYVWDWDTLWGPMPAGPINVLVLGRPL